MYTTIRPSTQCGVGGWNGGTQWTPSVHAFTHAQTCDNVCVQSATQWTASVHAFHVPKPVITFVFKVLSNGMLLQKPS